MHAQWIALIALMSMTGMAAAQGSGADSSAVCYAAFHKAGAVPGTPQCRINASAAPINMGTYYCTGTSAIIEAYCNAKPESTCQNNRALKNYEEVRNNDIPKLDHMPEDERNFLKMFLSVMQNALENAVSAKLGNPIPTEVVNATPYIVEAANANKAGDERGAYTAAIDMYTNLVFSGVPALQEKVRYLALSLTTLSGNGISSFAEQQDRFNRSVTTNALAASGCPANLTKDYHLPPYQPSGTSK